MKKMNKKGFTLIEMLVVIAIIAVLVSIIVPVVSNSTNKAKAATDAANLRSYQATLTIEMLNGTQADVPETKVDGAPTSKTEGATMYYTFSMDKGVEVYYKTATGNKGISAYSSAAGTPDATQAPAGGNEAGGSEAGGNEGDGE